MLVVHHRDQGNGSPVDNHFAFCGRAIGESDHLERQIDLPPLVDQTPGWLGVGQVIAPLGLILPLRA